VQYANEYLEFNKQNVVHVYDKARIKYMRDDNNKSQTYCLHLMFKQLH